MQTLGNLKVTHKQFVSNLTITMMSIDGFIHYQICRDRRLNFGKNMVLMLNLRYDKTIEDNGGDYYDIYNY